jgi:hypothetical protein
MDELQHLARQRVFQVGHVSVALDFKPAAGGLHGLRFGFAGKHVSLFFLTGGQCASSIDIIRNRKEQKLTAKARRRGEEQGSGSRHNYLWRK